MSDKENKDHRITLRVSDLEIEKICALQKAHQWHNPSMSEIIRDCISKCYDEIAWDIFKMD